MSEQKQDIYEFHNFQLDVGKGVLLRENQPVTLQWKTFELLCALVRSNGNLITRDELMNALWANTFVEDNNLSQHIRLLRKALGDGENGAVFIETVPRRGYRFLPDVRIIETADETVSIGAQVNQVVISEGISDKKGFGILGLIQPSTISQAFGKKNEAKIIAFPTRENPIEIISKSEGIDENPSKVQSAIKQNTKDQPKPTKRRRGFRRGLKCLLWGLGIGFVFVIFLQILQIASIMLFATPNDLTKEVLKMSANVISMLSIPVLGGWFFGIGLFLFGIARIIFALFEKENSRLNSSLFEKVTAVIITIIIAAVVIPNLIASYRSANESRRSEINNSHQNN